MTALTNADRTAQARAVDAFPAGDGRAQLSAGVAMTRIARWPVALRRAGQESASAMIRAPLEIHYT
jgi:hypothetical protein